jgi:hypothetical protein
MGDCFIAHVDLLYVYGRTADELFAAAEIRQAVGVSLPVLRPEHIIAMKVHVVGMMVVGEGSGREGRSISERLGVCDDLGTMTAIDDEVGIVVWRSWPHARTALPPASA